MKQLLMFYLLSISVLIFDQASKFLAIARLSSMETWPVIPDIFHFTLVYNKGIAFGLFHNFQPVLFVLITASLLVLFFWGASAKGVDSSQRFALAMILGGAIGNWIDRVRIGAVVDFLDFRVWPVFNIADSAITVGVLVYLWTFMKGEKTKVT